MTKDELLALSLAEAGALVQAREVSSGGLTRAALARIHDLDGRIGAFLKVTDERALVAAEAADARAKRGDRRSPFDGVPVAVKDILLTEGVETTAGSRILEGFVPPYSATVVERLEAAGAVIVGKLNLDEFAMGSSNENSAFFPCHNPWDLTRTPGGSSGGSAAAVAARMVFSSLGTDTGGSIRLPASFCGVVGLKPTYGRVPRWGVVAFASSLDQVGPFGRTVEDVALVLGAIAGHDPRDMTSSSSAVPDYLGPLEDGAKGLRIGVPDEWLKTGLEAGTEAAVREAVRTFERLGSKIVPVSLPHSRYGIAAYYVIAPAEASSNLARYDGVRFGSRAKESTGLRELYEKTRAKGFGPEPKRRIMLGTYALSAGYYDAYYLRAQKVRTLVRRDFDEAFRSCDLIAGPVAPGIAFPLGERSKDPLSMYLGDVFTITANLAALPGLSLPCGTDGRTNMPVGLQLIGRSFDEPTLLRAARAFERERGPFPAPPRFPGGSA